VEIWRGMYEFQVVGYESGEVGWKAVEEYFRMVEGFFGWGGHSGWELACKRCAIWVLNWAKGLRDFTLDRIVGLW